MRKELRFLFWGVFAGIVLGVLVSIAIQRMQAAPVSDNSEAQGEQESAKLDSYEQGVMHQLQAELLRFLGDERFRRFKAAGLVPGD